jgi:hypothetical protein
MDQQAIIKDKPTTEAADGPLPASECEPMPKMALAAIEPAKGETAARKAPNDEPKLKDKPAIALAKISAPTIAPEAESSTADVPEPPAETAPEEASAGSGRSAHRFALLAASLALAAGLGAMAGALAAATFLRPAPVIAMAGAKSGLEEMMQVLKENIVQARVELAALKVNMDGGIRNASAQFTRLGERIERLERTQGEPAVKLSKAVDTLERLARSEAGTTGSVTPQAPASPPPPVLDGWIVREVHRGTAVIEGRMGMIEVDKGDTVPGIGRIDAIRKQDGRWVVVTSKGMILSPR